MLKSYAAIYKQGRLEWLDDAPEQDNIQVIVTLITPSANKGNELNNTDNSQHLMQLAGKISAFKNIADPVAWQRQQRDEWRREWDNL